MPDKRLVVVPIEVPGELIDALAERIAAQLSDWGADPEEGGYLGTVEAAEFLATSPKRVYELKERGAIKGHRDGRRLLFKREELAAYVEQQDEDSIGGQR